MVKKFYFTLLAIPFLLFNCSNKKANSSYTHIPCDTIQVITDEPVFTIKGFSKEQTEILRFYLLDGSFKFRTRGGEHIYQIEKDTTTNMVTYQFGFSGFNKTDTLVFRTKDDLFFLFTNYHYCAKDGNCILSDTIIINDKQYFNSIITPDMGVSRDSLDPDLSIRFYWDDMM